MKRINRKELLRGSVYCILLALALCAALYAAYAAGVKSGLNAPGVEVIECPAETPEAASIGCPTAPPAEGDVLARAGTVQEGGAMPVFEAEFMGGSLQAYETDGGMLCICDPEPGADTLYRYVLFGPYEISAEEYVGLHGGPGIYDGYNEERKTLTWGWGEEYETVVLYAHVVETYLLEPETASIAWMLTEEEFEIFRAENTVRFSIDSTEMPNLSAAFEQ